jgi:hypothetical protein
MFHQECGSRAGLFDGDLKFQIKRGVAQATYQVAKDQRDFSQGVSMESRALGEDGSEVPGSPAARIDAAGVSQDG